MNQLTGTIETLYPKTGFRRFLQIKVALGNQDSTSFGLVSVVCRGMISFSERGRRDIESSENYIGEAFVQWWSRTVPSNGRVSLTLVLPVDFDLLGDIEDRRNSRDIDFSLSISFSGMSQRADGTFGGQTITGDVASETNSSDMVISKTVAKSDWEDFLRQWGYSDATRLSLKEIRRTIEEAQNAKYQAEEAARAAKQASELTAVTALSDAYSQEASVLGKRSLLWGAISLCVAVIGAVAMLFYVRESLNDKFTFPEAVIRSVVIVAIFGLFTLCLRIYEAYCHLEVVNRHRVNIGRTFEAFKAAQPTDRAKEVMAAITAENMLAFGKSGFAGKDSPNQGPLGGTMELIRAILEKPGH